MAKKFKITKQKIWAAIGVVVLLLAMAGAGIFLWWLQNKDRITSGPQPISTESKLPPVFQESQKLADQGKVEEANKKLQEAAEQATEPAAKQAFVVTQGVNYSNTGNYQKALELYLEAEKTHSNYSSSHLIAEAYEELGNKEKAIEYYKKSITQVDPELPYYDDEINMLQNKIRELGGQP